ncbi:hypothetical protein WDK54_25520, partial [Escherichia coli]
MKELGLVSCQQPTYRYKRGGHEHVAIPNYLERQFAVMKWSTKTGHRVRVFSSIDFPIRLVVTHHYIRAVLVRC